MFGLCNYFLARWGPSVTTACNSGYHEANNDNCFDPAKNANRVVASEGESSLSSRAFQAQHQPPRAENTEREAASTMKNLMQLIFHPLPARQTMSREHYQLTVDCDRLSRSLQRTHIELQQANSKLQQANSELYRANSEVRQLKDSVHHCQAELKASQCEITRLQDKERSMRDFLIESNHNQIVSDRDVCERFTQLRQRIQRLASNKVYNIEEFHNLVLDERWFEPRYVEDLWRESPKPGRLVILRSLMFQHLNANILDKLLFDINDSNGSPNLAGPCSPIPNLGQTFSLFERFIGDRGGKKPCKSHSSN